MLDAILERLVEREEPLASIVARGSIASGDADRSPAQHRRVTSGARRSGRQGHRKNFGRDRRYPITNKFAIRQGAAGTRRSAGFPCQPRSAEAFDG